jgi:signal transduction histidine kinase
LPCDGIFAFVEDDDNAVWLYSRCGLVRIARSELDDWWQHPDKSVRTELLDEGEGVQPGLTSNKPQASRTPDGRLWFVNGHVLQMIDINQLKENLTPPPVHLETVIADQHEYAPHQGLGLPALTRDLEIDYTAISFVAPLKVRFRYKLDGHDPDWQDPGTRRQAFYTDLHPGKYLFHVIACNNDGVWNNSGATMAFSIAPAWYQTIFFWVLCSVLSVLAAWSLYRIRVRQIAATIHATFDERLKERTRLARDFHDTLLQTIQGSKMVADDALDESADLLRMRRALERLSMWMGQATKEGRAALSALRDSTTQKNDLAEAFRRATERDILPGTMSVSFSVVGSASEMHPIVRDEVYRIGYEAIRNSSVHSKASVLEVELRYAQELTLRIKDNGIGIDTAVLDKGRDGHFGLQGMRERAGRIGAKISMVSSAAFGTEIKLVVPGGIIFRTVKSDRRSLLTRLQGFLVRRYSGSKPD